MEFIDWISMLQFIAENSSSSILCVVTTRLLVPSSKVGCILGQGGSIINEMSRRTQADIRVLSKEDKPKCAFDDEELVQICGSFGVARDALTEISLRLRTRCLCDAMALVEPVSVRPIPLEQEVLEDTEILCFSFQDSEKANIYIFCR